MIYNMEHSRFLYAYIWEVTVGNFISVLSLIIKVPYAIIATVDQNKYFIISFLLSWLKHHMRWNSALLAMPKTSYFL